jgi:hypothetical protein
VSVSVKLDSFSCSITSTMTCFLTNRSLVYFYHLANEVAKGYSNATVRPSFRKHPCEHSRINVLQWILIKLGTYLVLKRIWNPIDFQGHRSKVKVTRMYIFITTWWKSASAMGQLLKQLCFRLMPDLFCFCFFVRSYFY